MNNSASAKFAALFFVGFAGALSPAVAQQSWQSSLDKDQRAQQQYIAQIPGKPPAYDAYGNPNYDLEGNYIGQGSSVPDYARDTYVDPRRSAPAYKRSYPQDEATYESHVAPFVPGGSQYKSSHPTDDVPSSYSNEPWRTPPQQAAPAPSYSTPPSGSSLNHGSGAAATFTPPADTGQFFDHLEGTVNSSNSTAGGGFDIDDFGDTDVLDVVSDAPSRPTRTPTKYCGCKGGDAELYGQCHDNDGVKSSPSALYEYGYYPWTAQCTTPVYR